MTEKNVPTASMYMNIDEIKEKLKLYDRINSVDVKDLIAGTRITYIEVLNDGKFKFKTGGVIIVNSYPKYLVLINNNKSWSVQLDRHIIFKERYHEVIKNYTNKIKELEKKIKNLETSNKKLYNNNKLLIEQIKKN